MARKLFIGGEWVATDNQFSVFNKYDGSEIDRVHLADDKTIDAAINYAVAGFERMRKLSSYERRDLLAKAVKILIKRQEEFAQTICKEGGKCINEARGEADRSVQTFRFASEEAGRMVGEYIPLDLNAASKGRYGMVRRFPIGPVLGVSPFNFPLNLVSHKVAPALAVGSSIVLKPPTFTPLSSLLLGEVIDEAGFPAGAYNVICCPGSTAQKMVEDDRFKLITFTGSPDVGWKMKCDGGKKHVVLELGGDAACIVDSTADLDYAVERTIIGSFAHAGQICISIQRLMLEDSIADKFLEKFIKAAKELKMGDPLDETVRLGPMISEQEAIRADEWLQEAIDGGAEVLLGGERKGSMFPPTIITNVDPGLKLGCKEIFAPVVVIYRWSDFSKCLDKINSSVYGLQAGIISRDIGRITRAWEEIEVGGVIAGDIPTYRVDHMPYGGVKDSGFGREGIRWSMHDMSEERLLVVNPPRDRSENKY